MFIKKGNTECPVLRIGNGGQKSLMASQLSPHTCTCTCTYVLPELVGLILSLEQVQAPKGKNFFKRQMNKATCTIQI